MPPQGFISSYAPRLRTYANSLLAPVNQSTANQNLPTGRSAKRAAATVNYAEDGYDDDDFDDGDGPSRRPTGLRSLRREESNQDKGAPVGPDRTGRELTAPVDLQGIWRDWMGKPKVGRTDKQLQAQMALPLTLIPIRIDIDIPAFTPAPALPLPPGAASEFGINPTLPAYRPSEATPPFRLKDTFLWNLHETLMTPDEFATILVHDLDLPNQAGTVMHISQQIRQQLEEYAGVALHPLFHSTQPGPQSNGANTTQLKSLRSGFSRDPSATPAASTPLANGFPQMSNGHASSPANLNNSIAASATPLPSQSSEPYQPDDTYRCIVSLNINLLNKLYTDRFEWSLLHPPGMAETFATQTCADLGLSGEWVPAMTHAIYEAVLRLKKEACEAGGLIVGGDLSYENLAARGVDGGEGADAGAGWRYDHEHLADEWEPKVETLSKEEIEKREGDRERQIRRLRRETARFSSNTGMLGGLPAHMLATPGGPGGGGAGAAAGYFDNPEDVGTPMGRGERSKRAKRRFRSLSPSGRAGTPGGGGGGGRGTPDAGGAGGGASQGYGGAGGGLNEWERQSWRCAHCAVWGSGVWAVRDGPSGARSLCNNCGLLYERDKKLPAWSKDLHLREVPVGR